MRVLALVLLLAVGGCSADIAPLSDQIDMQARWNAENVYPDNYKADLLAFMRTYLNNPSQVRDAQVSPPQIKRVGPGNRYVVCVRYNARNRDGRYMGDKDSAVTYVLGKLDQIIDQPKMAAELCKDAAYRPFPELGTLTR